MNTPTESIWTPQQMEFAIKIENILMPSVRRQRDLAYQNKLSSQFVHYTSAESAIEIIKNKELWLRSTTCMDDYMEVQHGFQLINKFFSDETRKRSFIDALNLCHVDIGQQAIEQFNQWWRNIQFSSYIASVSKHDPTEDLHGRLSMWRGFGGNTARVAIVANFPWHSQSQAALQVMFNPVSYAGQEEVLQNLTNICSAIGSASEFLKTVPRQNLLAHILNMLITAVTCSKHEGFHEEREWRLLYSPEIIQSPLITRSTETVKGVPQIIYKLPLDSKQHPVLEGGDFSQIFERLIICSSRDLI